jgi:hypothetical protein
MALLFADENFSLPVVRRLRTLGHDVFTAVDAGMVNRRIPDTIVLEYARAAGTSNADAGLEDFSDLHHIDQSHAGIMICEAYADQTAMATRIHAAIVGRGALTGGLVEVAV